MYSGNFYVADAIFRDAIWNTQQVDVSLHGYSDWVGDTESGVGGASHHAP